VDGETGLMPLGNGERYYAPGLGSFIQQDSFIDLWTGVRSAILQFFDPGRAAGTTNDQLRL